MRKITDRFLLGVISGLGGNLAKLAVEKTLQAIGFSEETGAKKAAGIFLKKRDIKTPYGKLIGTVADNLIASSLGVVCIYTMTFMGKDNYLLKGAALGLAEWTSLYGVTSRIGATAIYPTKPKDTIALMLSHIAFGATKITIARHIGDERLFNPKEWSQDIKDPQEFDLKILKNKHLQ